MLDLLLLLTILLLLLLISLLPLSLLRNIIRFISLRRPVFRGVNDLITLFAILTLVV